MPRPTRILTWLMLAVLVGGHWGMLQVVAWTGMLIDYSQDNPFATAVGMTFDGDHPCAICKQVDECLAADLGNGERKAPGKVQKTMKSDALVGQVMVSIVPAIATLLPVTAPIGGPAGADLEPPRRPPRVMG
jgi:hypothetical protein